MHYGSYAPTWIKLDPGFTGLGSSKLPIKSVKWNILNELNEIDLLFSSVFLTILQIFCPEVTLIRDQLLINVDAYDPMNFTFYKYEQLNFLF